MSAFFARFALPHDGRSCSRRCAVEVAVDAVHRHVQSAAPTKPLGVRQVPLQHRVPRCSLQSSARRLRGPERLPVFPLRPGTSPRCRSPARRTPRVGGNFAVLRRAGCRSGSSWGACYSLAARLWEVALSIGAGRCAATTCRIRSRCGVPRRDQVPVIRSHTLSRQPVVSPAMVGTGWHSDWHSWHVGAVSYTGPQTIES